MQYYILQAVVDSSSKSGNSYFLWARWGRTGTAGQGQLWGPFADQDEVVETFDKQYKVN